MVRKAYPLGATAAHSEQIATTAATMAAGRHCRCASALRDPPMATTNATSRRPPSVRTTGASGLETWVIGSVANGTPPKGHRQRINSTTTKAPGNASRRPAPAGTMAAPAPKSAL